MLLALTLALTLQNQSDFRSLDLPSPFGSAPQTMIMVHQGKLDAPKISPKNKWSFDWLAAGYGKPRVDLNLIIRFRVFSQEPDQKMQDVARMACRLWEFNVNRLYRDHALVYNNAIVDFYLCKDGEAGGEQLFDKDIEEGIARKVNTIYIYQTSSFTSPVEMAREVAHEYGHATLPPVGGFETPEEWGNGYLGEKMYLQWLCQEIEAKRLTPQDAMGADAVSLRAWVKKNVDPLVQKVSEKGPDFSLMTQKGQAAMDAYHGLVLYAQKILPQYAFGRAMFFAGIKASELDDAILKAAVEAKEVPLVVPKTACWVPLPAQSKLKGAKVLAKKGNWAKIQPMGSVTLLNPGV